MTDRLTEIQLAEIHERCKKATGGEWFWTGNSAIQSPIDGPEGMSVSCDDEPPMVEICSVVDGVVHKGDAIFYEDSKANGDFIAHARQDVPKLLDTIAELEEQLENATCDIHTRIGCKVCKEMFRGESLADGTCPKCLKPQLAKARGAIEEAVTIYGKKIKKDLREDQVAVIVDLIIRDQHSINWLTTNEKVAFEMDICIRDDMIKDLEKQIAVLRHMAEE